MRVLLGDPISSPRSRYRCLQPLPRPCRLVAVRALVSDQHERASLASRPAPPRARARAGAVPRRCRARSEAVEQQRPAACTRVTRGRRLRRGARPPLRERSSAWTWSSSEYMPSFAWIIPPSSRSSPASSSAEPEVVERPECAGRPDQRNPTQLEQGVGRVGPGGAVSAARSPVPVRSPDRRSRGARPPCPRACAHERRPPPPA